MKIKVLAVCKNEEKIMPFFLDHYLAFADLIEIADGNSTDRSIEIAKKIGGNKVKILNLDSGEALDDLTLMNIRNHAWKPNCLEYDWQIVCDMDEFLYYPNLTGLLETYLKTGVTVPFINGYDMYSLKFPVENIPLIKQVSRGIRNSASFDKFLIFNPKYIENINYSMGCHRAYPEGKVKHSQETLFLLHYRGLDYNHFKNKISYANSRLSENNIMNNWGFHYKDLLQITEQQYKDIYASTKELISPPRSYLKAQNEFVYAEMYDWNVYQANREDLLNKNVLDVGGHFGMFTTVAFDHGAKQIIALEPNPVNFATFLNNTKDMPNVKGINVACTAKTGEVVKISIDGVFSQLDKGDTPVTTISLADALNLFPAEEQVVLKMDVEGAEHLIIPGTDKAVFSRVSDIFIEIHDELISGPGNTIDSLLNYICNLGYDMAWVGKFFTTYEKTSTTNNNVVVAKFKRK